MRLFSDFDVYERKYTYDEMKVMSLIDIYAGDLFLDYEDLCRIVNAVYQSWVDSPILKLLETQYKQYPWLEIKTQEEDGYIQAYAQRVLPEFIQLYKEMFILRRCDI